jgi:hypothetical protein
MSAVGTKQIHSISAVMLQLIHGGKYPSRDLCEAIFLAYDCLVRGSAAAVSSVVS